MLLIMNVNLEGFLALYGTCLLEFEICVARGDQIS